MGFIIHEVRSRITASAVKRRNGLIMSMVEIVQSNFRPTPINMQFEYKQYATAPWKSVLPF